MRVLSTLLLVLLATGCKHGQLVKNFPPANTPAGATVRIELHDSPTTLRGELFATDSTGLLLRAERLVHVRWDRLRSLDVERASGPYDLRRGSVLSRAQREGLALLSRFPQGLHEPLRSRVLAELRQDSVEEVP